MRYHRIFRTKSIARLATAIIFLSACFGCTSRTIQTRGIVLRVDDDLESFSDWPRIAAESGINTIGTHVFPKDVLAFMESEKGRSFLDSCRKYGIHVEHQLHAMGELLPRDLFDEDASMFRMDENGRRLPDFNCCVHSEKALDIIAENAATFAKRLPADNHRYYFWLDDGGSVCQCERCAGLTPSEQALVIENRMIKAIRRVDPEAMLAHLSYYNTMDAPVQVKPETGIFLEFAPFYRQWDKPISDSDAQGSGSAPTPHAKYRDYLAENLKVFPAETAMILEYWLDVSLFSGWKKPGKELPWRKDICASDVKTYSDFGIRHMTTFAVFMDSSYFSTYPQAFQWLKEYGAVLKDI